MLGEREGGCRVGTYVRRDRLTGVQKCCKSTRLFVGVVIECRSCLFLSPTAPHPQRRRRGGKMASTCLVSLAFVCVCVSRTQKHSGTRGAIDSGRRWMTERCLRPSVLGVISWPTDRYRRTAQLLLLCSLEGGWNHLWRERLVEAVKGVVLSVVRDFYIARIYMIYVRFPIF